MSMFSKRETESTPREVVKYAPPEVRNNDPGRNAFMSGLEAFDGLRSAYSDLEEHHTQTVAKLMAKESECEYLRLELAQIKNELSVSKQAEADAYRERDNVINRLCNIARQVMDIDFGPPPTPRKRKNGETKEVQGRLEDTIPVSSSERGEVREVRDVPTT